MRGAAFVVAMVAAIVVVPRAPVHAQPADVAAQIKLVETQPADMDRSTWKVSCRRSGSATAGSRRTSPPKRRSMRT